MEDFVPKSVALRLVKLGDFFESGRVLRYESALLQERDMLCHVGITGKLLDIVEESVAGDTSKWVLDSVPA